MNVNYTIRKVTDCQWLNLYKVTYTGKTGATHQWVMSSRNEKPIEQAATPDGVVIVPIIATPQGNRLVLTREYRVTIDDDEYGFPAGLIDAGETIEDSARRELKEETGLDVETIHHLSPTVFSSAGVTDESSCMALVTATGRPSTHLNEAHEQIEVLLYDVNDIRTLLKSNNKISAKAWGLLYHFAIMKRIEFPVLDL